MDPSVLRKKLNALATFSGNEAPAVERLGQILSGLDPWALSRMNPLRLAAEHGFSAQTMVDLFVRGAKLGLFDFEWNMICPLCGGIANSHAALHEVESESFHCQMCNCHVGSELDQQVEVAFSLNQGVAPRRLDPYASYENYQRSFYSQNFKWAPAMADFIHNSAFRSFTVLEPDEARRISFTARPGETFRLFSVEHHTLLEMQFTEPVATMPQVLDVDLMSAGFSPRELTLAAGAITVHVHSHLSSTAGLTLTGIDYSQGLCIVQNNPPTQEPFLTGKMLLNNQTFRDLYRVQNLPPDLKLKMSNLTILFTDLKGSTNLYEATGDMVAYSLVQEHFELLKAAIRDHSGALVKTIGDAVMSSFSNPRDGFEAAVDMMGRIKALDQRHKAKGHEIALKIGLHSGPVLAVNANETLDYFGQTVNVAARVQGLAYAGEIWITQPIYEGVGEEEILASGYQPHREEATLRGVREKAVVYKCA